MIYVVRDAKDTCITYFHHYKIMYGYLGKFEDFVNLFIGNIVDYAPFWSHALGYWKRRTDENVLFLKYEDMKKDLPWVIKKTATFLDKNLTIDQLSTLTEHLSFARMKENPTVNNKQLVSYTQKINNLPVTADEIEITIEMAHQITPVEGDLVNLLNKYCRSEIRPGFVKVDGYLFPERYKKFADAIENFEVRDDDIWVCSYPKAGTTWTQEMVWCIANDPKSEQAKVSLTDRFPFFEASTLFDPTESIQRDPDLTLPRWLIDSVGFVEDLPSPRFIKTHLPFDLLPRQLRVGEKKPKIIHVARNAKDSCVSFYHHNKLLQGFQGSFEDFSNLFIGNMVIYTPFWENVLSYQKKKDNKNLLLNNYEDMKKDLGWVIQRTATFLGKNLTTEQLSTLTEHLSFASMKANPAANNEDLVANSQKLTNTKASGVFIRSGNAEQWKTVMSPEKIKRFDDWTRECLKGTRS